MTTSSRICPRCKGPKHLQAGYCRSCRLAVMDEENPNWRKEWGQLQKNRLLAKDPEYFEKLAKQKVRDV